MAIIGENDVANLYSASATITVQNNTGGFGADNAAYLNLYGTNSLTFTTLQGNNPNYSPDGDGGSVNAIDLAPGAAWNGTFTLNRTLEVHYGFSGSKLTVSGGQNSVFNNNGTSTVGDSVVVGVSVVGTGTFTFASLWYLAPASLEFLGSVSAGQTISMPGASDMLILDNPGEFAGTVGLTDTLDTVDLKNLPAANGYAYTGNVLSIYAGNNVIDSLKINSSSPIQVEKTTSDLYVLQGTGGQSLGSPLPVYTPIPGPQFINDDSPAAEVFRLYQAAFNRLPDPTGDAFWINYLQSGFTPFQMAADFVATPEFQSDYGGLSTNDFVTKLYDNVLHRAPDPSGLAYWNATLANGASQAAVLLNFADSNENRVNTAPQTS